MGPYLPLRVAAPGVNVPRGGQGQGVLSPHSHVLDLDPRQGRDLLGPVVVPGPALREPDQTVWDQGEKRLQDGGVKGRRGAAAEADLVQR